MTPVTIANAATSVEDQCFGTISPEDYAYATLNKIEWNRVKYTMRKQCWLLLPPPYPTVVMVTWCRPKQIVIQRQGIAQWYSMPATTKSFEVEAAAHHLFVKTKSGCSSLSPCYSQITRSPKKTKLLKYEFHNIAGTKQFNASKIKENRRKHMQFRGFQNFVWKTEAVAFPSALNRSRHHKGPQPSMKINETEG